jgi:murein DD-endopeptidase MepM/ murein hydrolase activator NlpD
MPAILPVSGALTSGFGMRLGTPSTASTRCTPAWTSPSPTGTPVYATGDGIVQFAGTSSGYGRNIRIRHPKAKRATLYAHLSRIPDEIRPGTRVKRGDVIGYSGNTGLSTSPHLHYEIHDLNGEPINPIYSFAPGLQPAEYQELVRIAESENAPLD